jgi:hypothetical protein
MSRFFDVGWRRGDFGLVLKVFVDSGLRDEGILRGDVAAWK